jgi:Na+/melibiose symporter-like transporter
MPSQSHALRYGLPGFALAFAALPLYLLTPSLYAEQLGLHLAAVGLLLMATRLVDAFADPIIGRRIDRSSRHVWIWMASGVAVMAISLALLVNPPISWLQHQSNSQALGLLWMGLAALFVSLGNSVATLAHQSWAVSWTADPDAQRKLVASREIWSLVGVITAAVIAAQRSGPALAIVLISVGALGIWLTRGLQSFGVKRQDSVQQESDSWRVLLGDIQFQKLLGSFAINALANAIPATLFLFFVQDRLKLSSETAGLLLAIYFVAAAASVRLWTSIMGRIGARRTWQIAMGIAIVSFVWALTLKQGDLIPFGIICLATGFALGAELVCPPILLGALIDRAGQRGRSEASYFGIWNLIAKLALAAAAGLVLPALSGLGYQPGAASGSDELQALQWVYAGLPCMLKLIALVMLHPVQDVLSVSERTPS